MSAVPPLAPKAISIHNVGTIGKNRRVWLANQFLLNSFSIGDPVHVSYDKEERVITVEKAELLANHSISYRGKNKKTPILDIKNKSVTSTLDGIEKVEVIYYPNKVVIRASKQSKLKEIRSNKPLRTVFELFAGGGTLTHVFKKEMGLRSKGVHYGCSL